MTGIDTQRAARIQDAGTITGNVTVTPDLSIGAMLKLTCGAGGGTFTCANPIGPIDHGTQWFWWLFNNSGGALTITMGSLFQHAITAPANGKRRYLGFYYDATDNKWYQTDPGVDV